MDKKYAFQYLKELALMFQFQGGDQSNSFPLVSVHVITYNQVRYIDETLMSILQQDYKNIEIVVADDGSTDGTASVILEYSRKYPKKFIPIVGGPNLGITGNCNRALKACKGKYIAFIGGDDIFLPGKLSKQVEWFEARQERVLCGHAVQVFFEDGRQCYLSGRRRVAGKGPKHFIRHGAPFGALSIMVRADSVPKHGFDPSVSTVSDGLFFIETLMAGGEFGAISGVFGRYRKHNNNITVQWDRCVSDLAKVFEILKERYPIYLRDIVIGEANVILYGYGLKHLREGKLWEAILFFRDGISTNPFGYKLWVRLAQALVSLPFLYGVRIFR